MRRFDLVIFDMDGTIIRTGLDFGAIRAELGIPLGAGILETIRAMPAARRRRASAKLLEMELAATREATLMPSAVEVLDALRAARVRTALLTRNARESLSLVLERFGLRFDLAWSREDGPIKPEPVSVLRACRELHVPPGRTLCVGDYHYDLLAANAAGATGALLCEGEPPAFASDADYVITDLSEVLRLVAL